jgi:hypothetical protein
MPSFALDVFKHAEGLIDALGGRNASSTKPPFSA